MVKKSFNNGENNPQAKLTLEAVQVIRFLLDAGHKGTEIAEVYGLSRGLVSGIKTRSLWAADDEKLKDKWR